MACSACMWEPYGKEIAGSLASEPARRDPLEICSSQQDIPGKCCHKITACVLGHRQPCLKLVQWTCRTLDGSMSTAGHHHEVSMEVSTQVTAASQHQPGRKTRAHMSCLLLLFKLQAHMPAGAVSHHASEICRALGFLNALQDKAAG